MLNQGKTIRKTISPAALQALKQALTNIYWYKNDLRGFLSQSLSNSHLLAKLNWDDYKRNIVGTLLDVLAKKEHVYQKDILELMTSVCDITDFSYLRELEDGNNKSRVAENAVRALRQQLRGHRDIQEEQAKAEARRRQNSRRLESVTELQSRLKKFREIFYDLLRSDDPQKRGFMLERTMKGVFEIFDLDPKASFRIKGEQIDGAFSFEGTDYLLEAKWQAQPVNASDLDGLAGRVSRKLDNTLGLFLSINGYSEDGISAHSSGRRILILMDGSDLTAVLENRIDLVRLLRRKRRHASETGNIYLTIREILS